MPNYLKDYKRYNNVFQSYLGFGLTRVVEINSGTTTYIVCPKQPISCLLMLWRLQEPGHRHAGYWPPKPIYSVSSIRRNPNRIINILRPKKIWLSFCRRDFQMHFFLISNTISLKYVPRSFIYITKPVLVGVMAWHRDIQPVASMLVILKSSENRGTAKIGQVALIPCPLWLLHELTCIGDTGAST